MIAWLHGILIESTYNDCIIDVQGVGYDVQIPLSTFDKLPRTGEEVTLWISTQVREDAITLFGFAEKDEKKLFESLLDVSGIGGKLALAILSGMPLGSLCNAIVNGDTCSVIVNGTELAPAQISQINEIVYEQAGIVPANIRIVTK